MIFFMRLKKIQFLVLLFFCALPAYALSPENRLTDEKQEARAMNLFLEVRCLVCNGQVIENSDSEFSFQMRELIRKKISKGDSDEKIKAELIKKFGEDILTSSKTPIATLISILALLLSASFFLFRRIKASS
jgi:cytochrome c-type biogenesis protein CcmH